MDLLTLLASAIHDAKNQLHAMTADLDVLAHSSDPAVLPITARLRHRCNQLDQRLVALLGIYRLQDQPLVSVTEGYVADLLHGVAEAWDDVQVVCDPDLLGYFDASLLRAVISDALDNARRYARSAILLSARPEGRGFVVSIEDDGKGFAATQGADASGDAADEQAGLGIYFAQQVLGAHHNKGVAGRVERSVSATLGGAALLLHLP